jgi:hypothetical protein
MFRSCYCDMSSVSNFKQSRVLKSCLRGVAHAYVNDMEYLGTTDISRHQAETDKEETPNPTYLLVPNCQLAMKTKLDSKEKDPILFRQNSGFTD